MASASPTRFFQLADGAQLERTDRGRVCRQKLRVHPLRKLGPDLTDAAVGLECLCLARPGKSCDLHCQDETATRALRETLKLVYNLTLQGKAVGDQDEVTPCPMGGSARVSGRASAEATQGATQVELLYELSGCAYLQRDDEPEASYDAVISGVVVQQGILAVQPTATTALLLSADSVSIKGNVFDPPIA